MDAHDSVGRIVALIAMAVILCRVLLVIYKGIGNLESEAQKELYFIALRSDSRRGAGGDAINIVC